METATHNKEFTWRPTTKDVTERASWLLAQIQPTNVSAKMRQIALSKVTRIITECFGEGTLVCVQGSFPQRVYLASSDIDVVVFNPHMDPDTWPHTLVEHILRTDARFVSQTKVVTSAEVKLVKVFTQDITIDITRGRLGGVYAALLYERIDAIFGRCHLFKRSCVLLKAFMKTELRILGSSAGMLSSTALQAMLLHYFLQCSAIDCTPTSPLSALSGFLEYFSNIDLTEVVVFPAGLAKRKDLDGLSPSQAANECVAGLISVVNQGVMLSSALSHSQYQASTSQTQSPSTPSRHTPKQTSSQTMSSRRSEFRKNRDLFASCVTQISALPSCSEKDKRPVQVRASFFPIPEVSKFSLMVASRDLYPLPNPQELGKPVTYALGTMSMLGRILEECDSAWKDSVGEGSGTGYEDDPATICRMQNMWQRPFCIADPISPSNNVGRSVSQPNALRITKVFKVSAAIMSYLSSISINDGTMAVSIFDSMFRNTILSLRYQKHNQSMLSGAKGNMYLALTEPKAFRGDERALVKQITDLSSSIDNKKPIFQMPLLPGQSIYEFSKSRGGWNDGFSLSSQIKIRINSALHRGVGVTEAAPKKQKQTGKKVQLGQSMPKFRLDIMKPGFLNGLARSVVGNEPQIKFVKPKGIDNVVIIMK